MKLLFKKEFDGDMEKLPSREVEGAVPFKEPESMKKLSIIANTIALIISAVLIAAVIFVSRRSESFSLDSLMLYLVIASVLFIISSPIHELLHAICFRETVEFYTYLRKGLMFIVGTESMTKIRFIFMSLLPNIVFGFVPLVLFFIFPSQLWLGLFGAVSIGSGAGDYINVFNAATQMPKGSLCFLSKNRSYWYMPNRKKSNNL
ncbi:MAG: DUF3267 domain-containing protein [Clostridia bacterium]|nr:DUF3267 domain-containing protein [Clostridia bacterium]